MSPWPEHEKAAPSESSLKGSGEAPTLRGWLRAPRPLPVGVAWLAPVPTSPPSPVSSEPALAPPALRWDVWSAAQACRARVVALMCARFPGLGVHVVEDLFDDVCEGCAAPLGEPNAWPGEGPLEGFLRWRLERRLLNHLERRSARHAPLDELEPILGGEEGDPAAIVAARAETEIFARVLGELPEDARRYVADLQAGLKRAEIVEARGWGPKKLKRQVSHYGR